MKYLLILTLLMVGCHKCPEGFERVYDKQINEFVCEKPLDLSVVEKISAKRDEIEGKVKEKNTWDGDFSFSGSGCLCSGGAPPPPCDCGKDYPYCSDFIKKNKGAKLHKYHADSGLWELLIPSGEIFRCIDWLNPEKEESEVLVIPECNAVIKENKGIKLKKWYKEFNQWDLVTSEGNIIRCQEEFNGRSLAVYGTLADNFNVQENNSYTGINCDCLHPEDKYNSHECCNLGSDNVLVSTGTLHAEWFEVELYCKDFFVPDATQYTAYIPKRYV